MPVLVFGLLLLIPVCLDAVPYAYTTLRASAEARGINNNGDVVGFYYGARGTYAFVWSGGALRDIDPPGSEFAHRRESRALGISQKGTVVGMYRPGPEDAIRGFVLESNSFRPISYPGAYETWAHDVNDDGQIVGMYTTGWPGPQRGFLYDGGNYTSINYPGATATWVYGINEAGDIVGSYVNENGTHGFLYRSGRFTAID